ncbi:MAG: leucyl/phenylalanyl-tRNA--protein transferase [Alphaproteobacteria bacterium]
MIELTPDLILKAYACGVFPMAERHDASEVYWIDPDFRGILPLDRFHVPKRLARTMRSGVFEIRADCDFVGTVRGCARRTGKRRETWINGQIVDVFVELHERGYAHSVETWQDDRLVGGLYGVALGGAFFGESMFSIMRDASKVALVALVERLRRGGFLLLDTQFVTAHLRTFGATEVPRSQYLARLAEALSRPASFYSEDGPVAVSAEPSALAGRQSTTQTS